MKNYEKYKNIIREYNGDEFCNDFVIPGILGSKQKCDATNCDACYMLQMIWLLEEYKEPEEPEEPKIDWSKIEIDTPILVRDNENEEWLKRHFAKYEKGTIYSWNGGKTSWTKDCTTRWEYAKLAESEEE